MTHIEVKAQQLLSEAEKKLNNPNFFKLLFSKASNRIEESIEYYLRAANLFKMAENWTQAGCAFADAAKLSVKNGNQYEGVLSYTEAAKCFNKCDIDKAIDFYLKTIEIYKELGKILMAAKFHLVVAELFEQRNDIHEAVQHYESAASLFQGDGSLCLANRCLAKIAEYAALAENYEKAIQIFKQIAALTLSSSKMNYMAKQYQFCAAICALCCRDENTVRWELHDDINANPAFAESREYYLILRLLIILNEGTIEEYTEALKRFDAVSPLSEWQITLLMRSRDTMRSIVEEENLLRSMDEAQEIREDSLENLFNKKG